MYACQGQTEGGQGGGQGQRGQEVGGCQDEGQAETEGF